MDALAYKAAQAGLSAGVMILAVMVLRLRFRERTPRRVFCLLWDIVLVRLLVLAEMPSPVSIQRWLPGLFPRTAVLPAAAASGLTAGTSVIQYTTAYALETTGPCQAAQTAASPVGWGWSQALAALWLIGALALGGWFLWSHLRSRRNYAASLPVQEGYVLHFLAERPLRRPVRARCSDRIASPLTYGVLYPTILLPSEMDWGDRGALYCVLSHEYEHIRRFDTLRKGFLALALSLHWFNPLVWCMYILSNRDMELSCDEAVVRSGADRESYALALLDLEERRGRWSPSGSHFSQNALEERIKTIMKHKHISMTALVSVLLVMAVTTTVFASAAPEGRQTADPGQDDAAPAATYAETEKDGSAVMMFNGENGEKLYSVDGGRTWMGEERYHAEYGSWGDDWQVEWWTYEGYKAWLEQEKTALQEVIGSRGWTPSTGWFTWDQEKVDETVALYEETLENIKNGALYSKTILDRDGNEVEGMVGSDAPLETTIISTYDDGLAAAPKEPDKAALLEELTAFGFGGSENRMTYNGELIRTFVDGAPVGDNGYSIQYVYTNSEGTVDVHTLRSVVHNPDGSYDAMGALIGVAAAGDKGFHQALIDCAVYAGGSEATVTQDALAEGGGERGQTFEEIFARYAAYGLTYHPRKNAMGSLSWNGQPVRSFADLNPNGGAFSYSDPYAEEGLAVSAQYDEKGKLAGLTSGMSASPDLDPSQFIVWDKDAPYVQQDVTVSSGTTIYLPIQIKTAKDDSYVVFRADCEETITFGVTDLAEYKQSAQTDGASLRERFPLGSAGTYYAFLTNETGHDITVSRLSIFSSEMTLPSGTSLDKAEKAGYVYWVDPVPENSSKETHTLDFAFSAPVQGSVSAPFGRKGDVFHRGVDLAAGKGADVTAFASGTVSEVGFDAVLGNYVALSHADGYSTLYAHCGSTTVSEGASVAMGEKIAEVGASGQATGAVLHFELRCGKTYLDPDLYLTSAA